MFQRNLLYTVIARMKKVFVLVDSAKAIHCTVSNNKVSERNTRRRYSMEIYKLNKREKRVVKKSTARFLYYYLKIEYILPYGGSEIYE